MKQFENGRSMIEMLGVLAIIGVLSVGGLSGYTMAMNRHRANQILDYATRVAMSFKTSPDGESNKNISGVDCLKYNGDEAVPSAAAAAGCLLYAYGGAGVDQVTVKFSVPNADVQKAIISRSSASACVNNGTTGTTKVQAGNVAIDFFCDSCPCKSTNTTK